MMTFGLKHVVKVAKQNCFYNKGSCVELKCLYKTELQ
jgi:hypothetical protein